MKKPSGIKLRIDSVVLVTPLQPPFHGKIVTLEFEGGVDGKKLVVSQDDGAKVRELLGTNLEGRDIEMKAAGDGKRIRIRAVPS